MSDFDSENGISKFLNQANEAGARNLFYTEIFNTKPKLVVDSYRAVKLAVQSMEDYVDGTGNMADGMNMMMTIFPDTELTEVDFDRIVNGADISGYFFPHEAADDPDVTYYESTFYTPFLNRVIAEADNQEMDVNGLKAQLSELSTEVTEAIASDFKNNT